jgi:hypothetical protein
MLFLQGNTDPFEIKSKISMLSQGEPFVVYAASSATVDGFQGAQHASIRWVGASTSSQSATNTLLKSEIISSKCSITKLNKAMNTRHYDCGLKK